LGLDAKPFREGSDGRVGLCLELLSQQGFVDPGVPECTRAVPGALESFLALRGLRTLPLRMERAQGNARLIAARLEAHPGVERVRYPGDGSVLSFEVAGGAERAEAVCRASELFAYATSFGGVQSTMERRARWPQERGVPDALIRAAVGCEDAEDLWADLERALRLSAAARRPAAVAASPC